MLKTNGKSVRLTTADWHAPGNKENKLLVLYSRLDRFHQKICDVLFDLCRGTFIEKNYVCELLIPKQMYFPEVWGKRINYLLYVVFYDHPDMFWIPDLIPQVYYDVTYEANGLFVRVQTSFHGDHSHYGHHMALFEKAVSEFLKNIQRTRPAHEIERQIHDRLIDMISYDKKAVDSFNPFSYSAYGALVKNEAGFSNLAVCIGYSHAFQLLLQRCGIPAATIVGYAYIYGKKPDRPHAWNLICLDEEWYETDLCWNDIIDLNDPNLDASILRRAKKDRAHLTNIRHRYFNRTTEQMKDMNPGKEYELRSFWEGSYKPVVREVHIRCEEGLMLLKDMDLYNYMNKYLPVAKGVKYAYKPL
ncbi:MAG: hypothetical protein IJW67_03940 [Blautia sp.]|nr:hypothetical protein [Blautia sp.]